MEMKYFDASEAYKMSKNYSGRLGDILKMFEEKVLKVSAYGQFETSLTFNPEEYEESIIEATYNELINRGFDVDYDLNDEHSDGFHYIKIEWYEKDWCNKSY